MRYGVWVHNSKQTAQIIIDRLNESQRLTFTNHTVKAFLMDIVTLHDELAVAEQQARDSKDRAITAERENARMRRQIAQLTKMETHL